MTLCGRQVHHRGRTAQCAGSEAADALQYDRPVLWMRLSERIGWAPRGHGQLHLPHRSDYHLWMNQEPPTECLEVTGEVEVFEPRNTGKGWPPYRRLGRARDAAGGWRLVYLMDFGTQRERYAADDTWREEQVLAYLKLRTLIASPLLPAPLRSGLILPSQPDAVLEKGMHIPPGHLEAQRRVFCVEPCLEGTALPLLLEGPPLPSAAARGVLAALLTALKSSPLEPSGSPPALAPGHLELDLWLLRSGDVEVHPRFLYLKSADYAPRIEVVLKAPASSLSRRLSELLESLVRWAEADGEGVPSMETLGGLLRSIDRQERSWPQLALPIHAMPVTREQRVALATHVEQHLDSQVACLDAAATMVLSAPPAGPEVPRWQTSGLP